MRNYRSMEGSPFSDKSFSEQKLSNNCRKFGFHRGMMRPAFFITLAILGLSSLGRGAEAVRVFSNNEAGVPLYRIPGITLSAKGTLLAYAEARRKPKGDWGEVEVHLKRSINGGKTWSQSQHLGHRGERIPVPEDRVKRYESTTDQTVNNPVLISEPNGNIHCLYCVHYARIFSISSHDDGLTWSQPVEISTSGEKWRHFYPWNVVATGPGHGICLKEGPHQGRLLVPVWLAAGKNGEHRPSVVTTLFSDDHGQSWQAGELAIPDAGEINDPNESCLAELPGGKVLLNARSPSKARRRLQTISADGASNWSAAAFIPDLPEPVCMAGMTPATDRTGKRWLLFSNPDEFPRNSEGQIDDLAKAGRRKVTIKLSADDGKTWKSAALVDEGPSGYSDLAVLNDGTVVCLYEATGAITLRHFSLDELIKNTK